MKVAIIGAGNMGGAIARGLANGHYIKAEEITVSNPSQPKLDQLKAEHPHIHITNSNKEAAEGADIVIIAVKPWKVEEVLKPLRLRQPQILVSVAAGLTFENLAHFVDPEMPIFRVIPNTAIAECASMRLYFCRHQGTESKRITLLTVDYETQYSHNNGHPHLGRICRTRNFRSCGRNICRFYHRSRIRSDETR